MPFKKTENLTLTFPRVSPIKAVHDYWQSKLEAKRIKYTPVWDNARDSALRELAEARRVRQNAEECLMAKRSEAHNSRKKLDKKWNELFEAENYLKNMFIKFNKFTKENQEKRDRAAKRFNDEQALQEKRETDTETMRQKFAYVSDIKYQMETRIKEYRMYEDYLDAVVKVSSFYKNVNDILLRYEALIEAKNALLIKQDTDLSALEAAKNTMDKLIQEKLLVDVGQMTYLASLQGRYKIANQKALLWEAVVQRIQNVCLWELQQICQVRTSCYDMYLQVCERRKMQPTYQKDDTYNHLLVIKETVNMLNKVVRTVTKQYSH